MEAIGSGELEEVLEGVVVPASTADWPPREERPGFPRYVGGELHLDLTDDLFPPVQTPEMLAVMARHRFASSLISPRSFLISGT